jgi:hypothetical protein
MSDAEKARIFDRLVELLRDRLSLEKHYRDTSMGSSTIDVVRIDAYEAVVKMILGRQAWLGVEPPMQLHLNRASE